MLTESELQYCEMVLQNIKEQGYKYYVIHTVTERDNNFDFCIYFSKVKFSATDRYTFNQNSGYKLLIDSSSSSNYVDSRYLLSSFNSVINVNNNEFIYTNATLTNDVFLPDINSLGGNNNDIFKAFGLCLGIILCLFIFFRLFR